MVYITIFFIRALVRVFEAWKHGSMLFKLKYAAWDTVPGSTMCVQHCSCVHVYMRSVNRT